GDEHLVARLELESEDGEVERRRSRRDREGMSRLAGAGELPLELGHHRALGQHAALEHGCDRGGLLCAGVGPRQADHPYLARYHPIVLESPSSSSTFGSQPSFSRAFSTFGIRSSTST